MRAIISRGTPRTRLGVWAKVLFANNLHYNKKRKILVLWLTLYERVVYPKIAFFLNPTYARLCQSRAI